MTETIGDGWAWLKKQWDRWKITILFVGLAFVSLAVVHVNNVQNDRRIESACSSVTQVKNAALDLTAPVSSKGVTDAATLDRIKQANDARLAAQHKLERKLACR